MAAPSGGLVAAQAVRVRGRLQHVHVDAVTGERRYTVVEPIGDSGWSLLVAQSYDLITDRLPAFNTAPKDPAGTGDSLFTATAMSLCAGVDVWRASYIGALAAACQVGRVGNLPVTVSDIEAEIGADTV